MTRRPAVSEEDGAAIHAEFERYQDEFHETIRRHSAELDELMARHQRILRDIPGYPRWAGWKSIRT